MKEAFIVIGDVRYDLVEMEDKGCDECAFNGNCPDGDELCEALAVNRAVQTDYIFVKHKD